MKLNHIALNIQNKEDLLDFYQNILGFYLEYQFDLDPIYASKIFDVAKQPEVFLYKNKDIYLELFIYPENTLKGFAHICIEVTDREIIANKCQNAGYPTIRIDRSDKPELLFVRDRTGNIFELKTEQ
jgi:catechol 2,3-dioxygenase-like lactoylglutathione lyase family enzyme